MKNKKPEIRFKGFSEEWEERKLGELSDSFGYGLNAAAKEYDGINKYIRITDIDEDSRNFSMDGLTSPNTDLSLSENYQLNLGDILFARTGASVGKTYIYKKEDGLVYYAGFLIRGRIKKDINTEFVFQNTLTKGYEKFVRLTSQRSGQPGINAQEYSNFSIKIPQTPEEQTQIGNFFKNLDSLITLHQRKYEKLGILKKAMLEKMFPKNGANVPEIRFKGFSGAWEARNWAETVDVSTNMVDPKTGFFDELFHIGPGNIESFSGRIFDNVLTVKDSNLISGKFIFKKGDIIYGKINPQLAKYTIAPFDGLASADSYVLNTKNGVGQNFLYTILQSKEFYKYSVSVSARTGMPKINREELNVYNYLAPCLIEQQKIGGLFIQLDNLITLHQGELEKLKNLKKALLEKMFV
ncbi:restriction endonuclease subunit S [Runella sp. CRIBMP]|uniref:restriction endonuclease subunit S n=1 Tax=Runella sp. CRIBMP TaxID=2683261 RepID=UPI001411F301|nr:restriction endonuclease subunit S [Runella sp. CRIBMP]NBB19075.1 restriction endonuclease subunit S [Runella sp. CRIBMP]